MVPSRNPQRLRYYFPFWFRVPDLHIDRSFCIDLVFVRFGLSLVCYRCWIVVCMTLESQLSCLCFRNPIM
ncbi:hypothetical protein HanRHA438_Chr03g0118191 [Helianthus annuus]|nr:hypothetical protein HanRHA438_Chr03g0118191 [Helianthus annuus]